MPKIREYTQQVGAESELPLAQVRRQAFPSDFGGVGPGLTVLGRSMQEAAGDATSILRIVRDNEARQEVTTAAVELSKLDAIATSELQEASVTATPGDKEFTSRFAAGLSERLDQLRGRFQTGPGQQAFDRGAAELSSHYLKAAGLAQSRLAGIAATQEYLTMLDAVRNTVLLDPGQFERMLNKTATALNDPASIYSRIPTEKREELTRQTWTAIALSAVEGVIRIDPVAGKEQLESGVWGAYLDADNTQALLQSAEVGIHGLKAEAKRLEAAAEKQLKIERQETQNSFFEKLHTGTLTWAMIRDSNLLPIGEEGSKEHYATLLEKRAKEQREKPIVKEPSVFLKVLREIRSGKIINEAQIESVYARSVDRGRGITWEDTKALRTELIELRTPEGEKLSKAIEKFVTAYTPQIAAFSPLKGWLDPKGLARVFAFEEEVRDRVSEHIKAGKNPHDLFKTDSPDFLGVPGILSKYQPSMEELLKDMQEGLTKQPGLAPGTSKEQDKLRRPGESTTDYLKRTE